jgi:hypothetical protein
MPHFSRRFPLDTAFGWLIVLSAINGIRCNHPAGPADSGVVSNLRFAPSAFDSFKRNTELKFTLKLPETLNIFIVRRDAAGDESRVKRLIENARQTRGSHSVSWLGDTDNGLFAPAGMYLALVEIEAQTYETTVEVFHF